MATNVCDSVQITYKGDGTTKLFTFPFTYIAATDIDVLLWDAPTKKYSLLARDKWAFANATTIQFIDAPPPPPVKVLPTDPDIFNVKIARSTDLKDMVATFYPGSAIRAEDLNDDFDQLRLAILEGRCELFGEVSRVVRDIAWTKFQISDTNNTGETIFEQDQKNGLWTRGLNDKYVATSDAIAARLDPYVIDTTPPVIPLPGKEQDGKTWFDTQDLVQRFWDEKAKAWVTLANTGPKGDAFEAVVAATPPSSRNDGSALRNGDFWFNTNSATLFVNYDDGDSKQWVSTAQAGPPGPVGATGPQGPPGPIAPGNGVGINAAKQITVIDDGTF